MSSTTPRTLVDGVIPLEVPSVSTLVDLLHLRATQQPDQIAYRFLQDGEQETTQLNYQQLEQRAQAIAKVLQQKAKPGDRVLLLYPSGLEFIVAFFGCMYAGMIAVPAYPPRRNQKRARLEAIIQDAQPSLVLTNTASFHPWQQQWQSHPQFSQLNCWATDDF